MTKYVLLALLALGFSAAVVAHAEDAMAPAAAAPVVERPQTKQPELSMEMRSIAAKTAAKHAPTPEPAQKGDSPASPKSKGGFWQRLFGGS